MNISNKTHPRVPVQPTKTFQLSHRPTNVLTTTRSTIQPPTHTTIIHPTYTTLLPTITTHPPIFHPRTLEQWWVILNKFQRVVFIIYKSLIVWGLVKRNVVHVNAPIGQLFVNSHTFNNLCVCSTFTTHHTFTTHQPSPHHTFTTHPPESHSGSKGQQQQQRPEISGTAANNISAEAFAQAMKFCKYANSAMQYEDAQTAVDNLTKALNLLTRP